MSEGQLSTRGAYERTRDRWQKAHNSMRKAEADRLDVIAKHERRVAGFRENERAAYRKLYESVPCVYCEAAVGKPCVGVEWPTMHTSRAADCMFGRPAAKGDYPPGGTHS